MAACDSNTLNIKLGSTAKFTVLYTDSKDNPIDLTDYLIHMDFVDNVTGQVLVQTSIGKGIYLTPETVGQYTIDAGSTATWPPGTMPVDIKYTNPLGIMQHTEDFFIDLIQSRTA